MNEPVVNGDSAVVWAEGVGKYFRDFWGRTRVRAVRGLSLEVRRGEIFGLLGPNGAGKSTTMKMILGLLYPTEGRLTVLGESPRSVAVKNRIGYLPEESLLYPYLTAGETLDFFGRLFNLADGYRRERIDQLLAMIGLTHARDRFVGEFSKGMARRVSLAQALINDPEVVLLDEPTAGLDPIGCRQFKDLILALAARGKTVVLSSHLLADVEDVCDRIAILDNGTLCALGTVDELLVEQGSVRMTAPALTGESRARIAEAVKREAGVDVEWDHPRRTLEAFFLEVVGRSRVEGGAMSGVDGTGRLAPYLSEGESAGGDASAARQEGDGR